MTVYELPYAFAHKTSHKFISQLLLEFPSEAIKQACTQAPNKSVHQPMQDKLGSFAAEA